MKGCGSTTPDGDDDEGRPEGRALVRGNAIASGGDEKTRRRWKPGGGRDSRSEGAVWAEEDSNGSGTVVGEEANVDHSGGGGSQRKRAAGRGRGVQRKLKKNWEVREGGWGQLFLMATTRKGQKGGHWSATMLSPAVEIRKPS